MKKFITVAALFAAGTAFANAVVLSTNIPEGASASSGNYSGIAFSVSSDWLSGSLSSEKYSSFSLDSITLECAGSSSWVSTYKLTIYSGTTYYAVSAVLSTDESDATKATFTFETPVSLNLDTVYYARFCSSATVMNDAGNSVTGGSFKNMNQQLAAYSNSDLGTSDTTTGLLAAAGNNNNAVSLSETGYKANISLSGTPTSIPEPSAFGLLAGVGALALVAARRRRSRKAA